jgi:MFS family permease
LPKDPKPYTLAGTREYITSWSWRVPTLVQIAIPIVCLPGLLIAPESPRYLVSMDRIEEARQVLIKHHNGGVHDALIDYELEEIITTLRMEKESTGNTGWADMFRTKGNRHRTLISISLGIFGQWNGVGVVSYYFALVLQAAGITSVTDQTLLNGCLQVCDNSNPRVTQSKLTPHRSGT